MIFHRFSSVTRLAAGAVTAALALSVVPVVSEPAAAGAAVLGPAAVSPAVPKDAEHAADEATARAVASAHGHSVVVDSQSSPNLLIKARPDGYMEATSSQVPEQAKVGGRWTPIDTTLVATQHGFEPKVAAVPIRIGKGGTDEIVSVQTGSGDWITETWPYGTLPAPTVKKDAAVFKEVLPGVNLRVTATKAGMREVLVIKNAAAAQDERVAALRLKVKGARLVESAESGALEAQPDGGEPVMAATPLWWDSSHESATEETPGGVEPRAVESSVTGSESVLDVAAIVSEDVTYPVYVDPDWSGYLQYDWYTDRAYPNQSYLNPPENSAGYGIQNGVGYLSRAFYRFDTSFLAGKLIQNARFNVVQTWANSCASTSMRLWQYGQSGVGFTWNSDPAQWMRPVDSQSYNVGGPCQPAPGWVGFTATAAIQDAAAWGWPYQTLALRADDEGNSLTRKHYRWDAQLIVTYNSRPNIPSNPAMISPNRGCSVDPNNPSYVNGAQALTVKVNVTDPDPQNTGASFYVKRLSNGAQTVYTTPAQAQGANLTYTVPAKSLVDGEMYAWMAEGTDFIQTSAGLSPWCYFVIDSTKPGLPSVSIDTSGARIGSPLTAVITPPAGEKIAGYQVWWTVGAKTVTSPPAPVTDYTTMLPNCGEGQTGAVRVVCADASGAASIPVAPIDSLSTLWVAAYDRAGNVSYDAVTKSAASGFEVKADPVDLSAGHSWSADDVGVTVLTDRVGDVPITVGSGSWGTDPSEDPQLKLVGLTSLNRYWKAGVGHASETDSSQVPGFSVEATSGQLARYVPGGAQPAGTRPLYACAYGAGNMISFSSTCEAAGIAGRLLGYSWNSAALVPAGYGAREIFRCLLNGDYFMSVSPTCEAGAAVEGSRGFLAVLTPTMSAPNVVDTTKSFTVSARVSVTAPTSYQTVVAASNAAGSRYSGFYLQTYNNIWRFCMNAQGATAVQTCANGPTVEPNTFVTVSGVWDATNKRIRIVVVSGAALSSSEAVYVPPANDVPAGGAIMLGSAVSSGIRSDILGGSIANVSLYPAALPDRLLRQIPVPQP